MLAKASLKRQPVKVAKANNKKAASKAPHTMRAACLTPAARRTMQSPNVTTLRNPNPLTAKPLEAKFAHLTREFIFPELTIRVNEQSAGRRAAGAKISACAA